ncbi:MAG TPA: MarR family transcriptional regulator [Planctomycetaceae bacterium]|nr:MarR family transcriptional regulator [Planctomycetaceae bacterium]
MRRLDTSAQSVGALLVRTAGCLTASLHGPTAQGGLNESRYNVLDLLRNKASGGCCQTELATGLLQSESNLSTLLDRMRKDGLISRVRCESDRRKTLIAVAPAGLDALARADQARARATAKMLSVLDDRQQAALRQALGLLLERLERELAAARNGIPSTYSHQAFNQDDFE